MTQKCIHKVICSLELVLGDGQNSLMQKLKYFNCNNKCSKCLSAIPQYVYICMSLLCLVLVCMSPKYWAMSQESLQLSSPHLNLLRLTILILFYKPLYTPFLRFTYTVQNVLSKFHIFILQ